ncbi:MAG TPA: ABC transporter ATP-binding protein [Acidimicrobiales bacterium]|jgi:branched-chain amino acid transport system ATP-binding protein
MGTDGDAVLDVSSVVLQFGGVRALDDVSFAVQPGELFAIIGPNGAGKTSIFNCLNGVYRPRSGRIRFCGHELVGAKPADIARLGMGRTFQNLGLFANLDIVDNLMLGRHMLMTTGFVAGMVFVGKARREELEHRHHVEEIIDLLDLTPYRGSPVGLLPYGVQKRLELGRVLAMEPRLLLLDEPAAGMNREEKEDLARYLIEIREAMNVPMLLVEHDMPFVMDLADRVMALDFGSTIATGSPAEIQSNPDVIAAYLGAPV